MIFRSFFFVIALLLAQTLGVSAQTVPNSYEEAKKMGDVKFQSLLKSNEPKQVKYVVLKKGHELNRLLKYDNAVYVIDKDYDLEGKSLIVPSNSVIVFRSGNIINGSLVGVAGKYCSFFESKIRCQLIGDWERIAPIFNASEVGLKEGSPNYGKHNYECLQRIVKQGYNLFLDGSYHISFKTPLPLNYQLFLFGGELTYERNAFRLEDNGGLVVNGTSIIASPKYPTSFFCGQKEYLGAITIKKVAFYNCKISCYYLVNLYFEDIDSDKTPFGLNYLELDHCEIMNTGRVRVLDAICPEKCSFTNNYYHSFFTTPIYVCCHHSVEASPDDSTAYKNIGNNLPKGSPVIIRDNIFIGKQVSENSYYCAALIKSRECQFTGNYIQDVINFADGTHSSTSATAYDAYLSCVSVLYENNFVADMMSFTKDGGTKPECQIGKSKTNPLFNWGWKSERIYQNNCFIVDGVKFKKLGANPESLFTDIFANGTYIDRYVWRNNSLIYKDASIKTGIAANSYGSFLLENCYFEVADAQGKGLVTVRSDQPMDSIIIRNNTIRQKATSELFPLFNQKYYPDYRKEKQKLIEIKGNRFYNTAPSIFFFTGKSVYIKDNVSEDAHYSGNLYLSKYNGSGANLDIDCMDAGLQYSGVDNDTGGMYQYLSSSSNGNYSITISKLPQKGLYYFYTCDKDHSFLIQFIISISHGRYKTISIPFNLSKGKLSYRWNGHMVEVLKQNTQTQTWYQDSSISFKSSFYPSGKNQVYFYILPKSESINESTITFSYLANSDK